MEVDRGLADLPGLAGGLGGAAGGGRVSAGRLVLGIETSCDDTSVAVLEDGPHGCART